MASNSRPQFKHPIIKPSDTGGELTADAIIKLCGRKNSTVDVLWNGQKITVKRLLSFRELSQLITNVTDFCFDREHEIAIPEAYDFAIRLNVIMMYAGILLDADLETQFYIAYESGLYESIIEVINSAQLDAITNTVRTCVMHLM